MPGKRSELFPMPVHIVYFSVILIELYTLYLFDLIQGLLYQPRLASHLLWSPGPLECWDHRQAPCLHMHTFGF